MPNEGQRPGKLVFEGGIVGKSRYQECKSRKPLLSVSDLEDTGNMTLFSPEASLIAPISDPAVKKIMALIKEIKGAIKVHKQGGTYKILAWVIPDSAPNAGSVFTRHS